VLIRDCLGIRTVKTTVTGGGVAAAVLQRKATAIVNAARIIANDSYHFPFDVCKAKM